MPRTGTVSAAEGVVTGAPRRWLLLEGLVLLAGALIAFAALGQPWWLVPAAILAPDIAMTGYLAGTRPGAHLYNLTHATPLPALMLGAGQRADTFGTDTPSPRQRQLAARITAGVSDCSRRPHSGSPSRAEAVASRCWASWIWIAPICGESWSPPGALSARLPVAGL